MSTDATEPTQSELQTLRAEIDKLRATLPCTTCALASAGTAGVEATTPSAETNQRTITFQASANLPKSSIKWKPILSTILAVLLIGFGMLGWHQYQVQATSYNAYPSWQVKYFPDAAGTGQYATANTQAVLEILQRWESGRTKYRMTDQERAELLQMIQMLEGGPDDE